MKLKKMNKLIPIIGNILVAFSLYYLFVIFKGNIDKINISYTSDLSIILLSCVVLSLISYIIMAFAWKLQVHKKYPNISLNKSIAFIGLSQIAKYLPGNIGHILARGALLRNHMKMADITQSFIIESLVLTFTSLLFGLVFLQYTKIFFSTPTWVLAIYIILGLLVFILIILKVLPTISMFIRVKFGTYNIELKTMFSIFLLHSLLILSSGITLLLISSLYPNIPEVSYWKYISGFALSFVIGFLMPGAPAGIGVREATFVMLFGSTIGEQIAMEMILMIRLISIMGDALFFLLVYPIKSKLLA